MKTIHIQSLPKHGLVWIAIPKGTGLTGACEASGVSLDSQFIPAPFPCEFDGFLLINAPAAPIDVVFIEVPAFAAENNPTAVAVNGNTLRLSLGGCEYIFDDFVENQQAPGMPNQELAYDAVINQNGLFRLFGGQTKIFTVSDGPLARIERALTSPVDCEKGEMDSVQACYDFVIYKKVNMVQVIASFAGVSPARATFFRFMNIRLRRSFDKWEGGLVHMSGDIADEPGNTGKITLPPISFDHYGAFRSDCDAVAIVGTQVKLSGEEGSLTLACDIGELNRDLNEYGPSHPFSACLLYGKDANPRDWVGNMPAFYRMKPCTEYTDGCANGNEVTLRAGDLLARFTSDGHGAELTELRDLARDMTLMLGGDTLFTVMVREIESGKQIRLSSDCGWEKVTILHGCHKMTMIFDEAIDAPGISALLTARTFDDCHRITWEMDVRNSGDKLTVLQSDYPRLTYDAAGITHVFVPAGSGMIYENVRQTELHEFMQYSQAWAAMQYMCCWFEDAGRGLYYGIHDPSPTKKDMISDRQSFTGRGRMIALMPAEGINERYNSQKLPGQAVWQLFDGDWYDAAQIYREWVLANAKWVPAMTDNGRPDVPQWLREAPLWFQVSANIEGWAEELIEAAKNIGVPASAHVYNWHQIPFDNDYPHYFPARQSFIDALPVLKESGVRLMPYINSRLWDMLDRGTEDYQFTSVAKPAVTKNVFGNVIAECYGSKEEDGSLIYLGVMCPTTAVWQETQQEICRRIFEEFGVAGIYLDQIAAGQVPLCFDKFHSHRAGGGAWWAAGYADFMDHLRRVKPRDAIYSTECNAEIYMNQVDAYLTWHWARSLQVPAFPAVYAGYIPMFGRAYSGDRTKFRILVSQSLLFGEQIGWLGPHAYLNAPERDLFYKCVQARWRYTEYFYAGKMLRPPKITCGLPEVTTLSGFQSARVVHSPAVRGAMWQCLKDGARIFLIVNIADEVADADIEIDAPDCEVALTGDLNATARIEAGRLRMKLDSLSVTVGELRHY